MVSDEQVAEMNAKLAEEQARIKEQVIYSDDFEDNDVHCLTR
jgi:hypothetical protein